MVMVWLPAIFVRLSRYVYVGIGIFPRKISRIDSHAYSLIASVCDAPIRTVSGEVKSRELALKSIGNNDPPVYPDGKYHAQLAE